MQEFENLRFYIDPETGQPHIHKHGVAEEEVEEVLSNPGEVRRGREGSRAVIGQTHGGRYLQVILAPWDAIKGDFVITAYELMGKPLLAYRRRRRRKQ